MTRPDWHVDPELAWPRYASTQCGDQEHDLCQGLAWHHIFDRAVTCSCHCHKETAA